MLGKVLCPIFSQTFVVWTYLSPTSFFLDIPNDTCSEQTIHERLMKKKHGIRLVSLFFMECMEHEGFFLLHFLHATLPGNKALFTDNDLTMMVNNPLIRPYLLKGTVPLDSHDDYLLIS